MAVSENVISSPSCAETLRGWEMISGGAVCVPVVTLNVFVG